MSNEKNTEKVGGVREMEAAIDRFEKHFNQIDTSLDEFDAAIEDLKNAKAYSAKDAAKLEELRGRAKDLLTRAGNNHRKHRRFTEKVYQHARTISVWMHERATQAKLGAEDLRPKVEVKDDSDDGQKAGDDQNSGSGESKAQGQNGSQGLDDEVAKVLTDAGLDAKVAKALEGAGVTTREQLVARVEADDLTEIKGIGKSTATKIQEALTQPAG